MIKRHINQLYKSMPYIEEIIIQQKQTREIPQSEPQQISQPQLSSTPGISRRSNRPRRLPARFGDHVIY